MKSNHIYNESCITGLANLPEKAVQMCVTSPPYFGLRDYGHPDQLGLEETPEQYVSGMVEVFRQVRRVLKDDGVLWLNLGDSYAGAAGNTAMTAGKHDKERGEKMGFSKINKGIPNGLKPKDLIGIPWRVAFALQADGWYLRQDIIWHKPNPMPESVTDRCTKAHEYIFLLSKSERYFYDADSLREPYEPTGGTWKSGGTPIRNVRNDGTTETRQGVLNSLGRNKRSVWTIPTQPYSEAHFAVFPPDLIVPCVKAGSRPGDVVLDPFFGSGTTGEVALRLERQYIGFEINPDYIKLAEKRLRPHSVNLFTPEPLEK